MKTRGFVTLATGKEIYYKMARNLLRSYRLHNNTYRFAILCDRENEYTKEFDDVILLKNVAQSYKDKIRLLLECPYEENIFIETDCLIYRNIDAFWDLLAKESDFSSFGWNTGNINVWFQDKTILKEITSDEIDDVIPIFNPGYLFIRKSNVCEKMYYDIQRIERIILEKYSDEQGVFVNGQLRDDPLLCLGMKFNGCFCTEKPTIGKCIFIPAGYKMLKINLKRGILDVKDKNERELKNCALLHFSTRRAKEEGLYLQQVCVLNMLYMGYPFISAILNTKIARMIFDVGRLVKTKMIRYKH